MTPPPNLHEAFLTAGNNLQPIGDWFRAHWLPLTVLLASLAFAAWVLRRIARITDQRTRNDRVMARRYARHRPTPEQQQPGSDNDLLIAAHLAYYGPTHQNRKEKPQP